MNSALALHERTYKHHKLVHKPAVDVRLDPRLKEKLTMRALSSEEDINANRLFDMAEVIRRTSR